MKPTFSDCRIYEKGIFSKLFYDPKWSSHIFTLNLQLPQLACEYIKLEAFGLIWRPGFVKNVLNPGKGNFLVQI